jgi:hypothetical protein
MLAVFASGIGVGALGYHSYTIRTVMATPKRSPEEWRKMYVEDLRQRLQLDAKQVGDLNTILDETRTQFHALRSRQKTEADLLRDQIRMDQRNKVTAMLKPEQRDEYHKFWEERDRKMKAEMAAREQAEKKKSGKAGN